MNPKYIITKDNDIIIFSAGMNHSDFKHMNPIRAGFISIGVDKEGNPDCSCYGRSISLDMESDPQKDTLKAKLQLNIL
jgi:hypothetical protein